MLHFVDHRDPAQRLADGDQMAQTSTIFRDASARSHRANKQIKFIVGSIITFGLIIYLIFSAVQSAGAYYREVHEVLARTTTLTGKMLRVSGNVVTDSIVYNASTLRPEFQNFRPRRREQDDTRPFPRG